MKSWIKYALLFSTILLTGSIIRYRFMVSYLAVQGIGQLHMLISARDVSAFLEDPSFPDDKKEKLLLINKLKLFAVTRLGLVDNGCYSKMYDQKGKPILWMVKAAPPFSLKPKSWDFPIVGTFHYISYFSREDAISTAKDLKEEGLDVWISEVAAWSTLGYMKDPVLSSMLDRSEGDLARLIFHEMTHGTVFIKGDLKFNENFATFIGDTGAVYYLEETYGNDSPQVTSYIQRTRDSELLNRHLVNSARRLRRLYDSFTDDMDEAEKIKKKDELISTVMEEAAALPFHDPERFKGYKTFSPNNAWFIGFLTYNEDISKLQEEFSEKFGSDYREMVNFYRKKSIR